MLEAETHAVRILIFRWVRVNALSVLHQIPYRWSGPSPLFLLQTGHAATIFSNTTPPSRCAPPAKHLLEFYQVTSILDGRIAEELDPVLLVCRKSCRKFVASRHKRLYSSRLVDPLEVINLFSWSPFRSR